MEKDNHLSYEIDSGSDSLCSEFNDIMSDIFNELSSGLLYTHSRITFNTKKTLEASSFLYALVELLNKKGIISIEELDERKREVAERLVKKFEDSRIGLLYQDPDEDKYSFKDNSNINCQNKINICKAVCCKIPFALSQQDVIERIIRWEFGRPYLIAHDKEGYCVHIDKKTYRCSIYKHRPIACRGFDCRKNKKWPVWKDYMSKIINPAFDIQIKESNQKFYVGAK